MSGWLAGAVVCSCGKHRGVIWVDQPATVPIGILLCPRCDWAHEHAAGPPPSVEHRIRDVDPRP